MKKKVRQFWCELFDEHEWKEVDSFDRDGIRYVLYRCSRCRKEKAEPLPIMLTTVFNT